MFVDIDNAICMLQAMPGQNKIVALSLHPLREKLESKDSCILLCN